MCSPTNTGDELNFPFRRPDHASLPVVVSQQTAVPASCTANRWPSFTSIDGTYTRVPTCQTTCPDPSALIAETWFFGYPPLVKTCVPSVTVEVTHSVVAPFASQL